MKPAITTALEVVGLALITTGIALVWVPGAFIAAGIGFIALSYLIERGRK